MVITRLQAHLPAAAAAAAAAAVYAQVANVALSCDASFMKKILTQAHKRKSANACFLPFLTRYKVYKVLSRLVRLSYALVWVSLLYVALGFTLRQSNPLRS